MNINQQKAIHKIHKYFITPYALLFWLLAVIISYFSFDEKIALSFRQIQHTNLYQLAQVITKFGYGLYYIMGLTGLLLISNFILKKKQLVTQVFFLLLAVALSGLLCDFLKIIFGRARPIQLLQNDLFGFHFLQTTANMWSFPSGHATTITALMLTLCVFFPRAYYQLIFVAFTLLICFTRLVVGAHYLSDILASMVLGAATVLFLWQQFQKHERLS